MCLGGTGEVVSCGCFILGVVTMYVVKYSVYCTYLALYICTHALGTRYLELQSDTLCSRTQSKLVGDDSTGDIAAPLPSNHNAEEVGHGAPSTQHFASLYWRLNCIAEALTCTLVSFSTYHRHTLFSEDEIGWSLTLILTFRS